MGKTAVSIAIILAAICPPVSATIIHVPGQYVTIQAGVDAASYGDTVLVAPGVYMENVLVDSVSIYLASNYLLSHDTLDIANTIIDGDSSGTVVRLENSEDSTAIICGFTIRRGFSSDGGGISCISSSPKICHNIIIYNTGPRYNYGAGIYIAGSHPIIEDNIIANNSANHGGGIDIGNQSNPLIFRNIIYRNSAGGGVECLSSNLQLISNVIVMNSFGVQLNASGGTLVNNIIVRNLSQVSIYGPSPSITYCNIQGGWEGEGNIDLDPLFISEPEGNFNLCSQSPCINAGDPNILDPNGTRSDIGLFYQAHPFCGGTMHVSIEGSDTTGDGSVTNPFRTIQYAIDNSETLDSIIVHPGIYEENVNFNGHNVVAGSLFLSSGDTSFISITIIDGDSAGAVATFINNEDETATLAGFTIQHGLSTEGGGVHCINASPTIRNNKIISNYQSGIWCSGFSGAILDNLISDNNGDGIYSYRINYSGNMRIGRNEIRNNNSAGIHHIGQTGEIFGNFILANGWRGIWGKLLMA